MPHAARLRRSLLPLLALGLSACGAGLRAGPPSPLPDHAAALESLAEAYLPTRVAACLAQPVPAQRGCRDTIGYALMAAIDLRYLEFEAEFFDQARYAGFFATLVTLGLTGAGSVAMGPGTANILSAIATGVTGAREAFTREVLAERTAVALMTAMRGERARIALRLRQGLSGPAEAYPLGWALSDLFAYYRAGTIPGALSTVTREVGASAERAQDNLTVQTLTGFSPVDVAANRAAAFGRPIAPAAGPPRVVAPGVAQTASRDSLRRFMGLDGSLEAPLRAERIREVAAAMGRLGIAGTPASLASRPDAAAEADRRRVIEALRVEGRVVP